MEGSTAARTSDSAPISAGCVMGRATPQDWPRNQIGMCLFNSVLAPPGCAATAVVAACACSSRSDLTLDDVKVLVMSCCNVGNDSDGGQAATRRLLSVVAAGLRPEPPAN